MNQREVHSHKKERKPKIITYIALLVCILAVGGMFCYQKNIGPFAQSTLSHPKVEDKRTKEQARRDFSELTDQIFREEVTKDTLTLNYTVKNKKIYDLQKEKPTLGDYSLAELKNSMMVSENRIATLETYDYNKLSKEQQLIYDTIYMMSKWNLESADILEYCECLSPSSGIQAELPIFFAEYKFYEKKDVEDYISLLKLVPRYFEQIIQFEEKKSKSGIFMNDKTAQAIITQCENFAKNPEKNYLIGVFNRKISSVPKLRQDEIDKYKEQNKAAILQSLIPAYHSMIEGLTKLKGTGKNENGLCHFDKGKKYYEYLVKVMTGSSRSISDIDSLLEEKLTRLKKDMAQIMAKSPDAYYDAQNVKYPYDSPQKAMKYLKKSIQKEFPRLDDSIKCQIKYVDKSLEEKMSPAFYLPPAIDDYKQNVVYVNQNKKYDLTKSFTIMGHEGYPGHLYQCCYFNSQNPAPIRNVIHVGGYSEGWGTYAEIYSYDLAGLNSKVAQLMKKNTQITLCIYGKVDIGIHYYGWDYKKVEEYLKGYGFSAISCRTIFDSVIAEPADNLKYTLGYYEIENLVQEAKEKLGSKFNLKEFHQFFLSIGPVPFDIIQDRMTKWIEQKQAE